GVQLLRVVPRHALDQVLAQHPVLPHVRAALDDLHARMIPPGARGAATTNWCTILPSMNDSMRPGATTLEPAPAREGQEASRGDARTFSGAWPSAAPGTPAGTERTPHSLRAGETSADGARRAPDAIRRFRLTIVEGPDVGASRESTSDRCSIGSHPLNDLVIADPTVSRFHCEIRIALEGAVVTDLKSRNGTIVDGVQVREAFLRGGSLLRLGRAVVRFEFGVQRNQVAVSPRDRFG